MWTQIDKTQNNISTTTQAYAGTDRIQLVAPSTVVILKGMWLVIEPFTPHCEIREVLDPAFNNTNNLIRVGRNFNFDHTTVVDVFIQTSPNWDILLFGADTKSTTVNTIAIRNAAYDCAFNGGGIVSIPKGRYIVNYLGQNNYLKPPFGLFLGTSGCITLKKVNQQGNNLYPMKNVKFVGEGIGVSIIQLETGIYPQNSDVHIFYCLNASGIEWHDLTLDGNRPNSSGSEQMHGIKIDSTDNVFISNIECVNSNGDGVYLLECSTFNIFSSRFIFCKRNGISINRSVSEILIKDNYFEGIQDTDIDSEPTFDINGLTPTKITITGNICIKNYEITPNTTPICMTMTGFHGNGNTVEENYIVTNNIFKGGGVHATNCTNAVFSNNYIEGHQKQNAEDFAFLGRKIFKNFIFTDNIIIDNSTDGRAVYFQQAKEKSALGIVFSGNSITNGECQFEDCHELSIINNKIMQYSRGLHGIHIQITNTTNLANYGLNDFGNLVINGNQITQVPDSHDKANSFIGILLTWQGHGDLDYHFKYNLIDIDNNIIKSFNLDYGIFAHSSGTPDVNYWNKLIVGKGNQIGDCNIMDIDVHNTSYQIAENPAHTQWISNGSPEDKISGAQGFTAVNKQQEADNKYRHNQIIGDAGWTLQSEMNKQVLFEDAFLQTNTPVISDIPRINILGNSWVIPNNGGNWNINNDNEARINLPYPNPSPNTPSIITINIINNCEIKSIFRNVGTSNGSVGGLIFRYDSSSSYWCLLFENNSRIISLRKVNTVIRTTSPIGVNFGNSHIFTLKVILKDDFISVFYNDLFLWTVKDNYNQLKTKHGLLIRGAFNMFYCRGFKVLK